MMPSCKQICENASDYLEGPSPPLRRLLLRMHLLMCKHCRRFLRQFSLASRTVAAVGVEDSPSESEIEALIARFREYQ
jgi:predicted anti-sigma-YlaC factor YlaD